jgi:hypothetical protein
LYQRRRFDSIFDHSELGSSVEIRQNLMAALLSRVCQRILLFRINSSLTLFTSSSFASNTINHGRLSPTNATGIMLTIEIQRGRDPMRQQAYQAELGSTAACTRRLCEAASYSGSKLTSRREAAAGVPGDAKPESFLGDSWFTGIRVAEWAAEQGHSYFGALKTSTKHTPYQELIDKMADFPSGSYLVLECTTPKQQHKLICIGYKYSARKVLVFLGTKSAGSTKPGEPYIARFPDANGNVAQRSVPRPDVISKYFNASNVIDSHNQSRQFELALEKRWITHDCWFRLDTTLIAMTVTDCWRAFKHAMPLKKDKEITIKDFSDRMAYDCIYNCYSDSIGFNSYLATAEDDIESNIPRTVGGRRSDVSSVTEAEVRSIADIAVDHPFRDNPEREKDTPDGKQGRPIRRTCRALDCKRMPQWMCFNRQCLQHQYMAPKGLVRGVFYCELHQYLHYLAIQSGSGI